MRKYIRRCYICARFESAEKPCQRIHNMERYYDRMEAEAEAQSAGYWDAELARRGGLDAVQERNREDYFVSKYGEY